MFTRQMAFPPAIVFMLGAATDAAFSPTLASRIAVASAPPERGLLVSTASRSYFGRMELFRPRNLRREWKRRKRAGR